MKLTLQSTHPEVDNVITLIFEPEQPVEWKAGQYMHYTLEHTNPDSRKTDRWFTIAAAPHEGHVQITTRLAPEKGSSFKHALAALQPGDTIQADPPEGDFVIDDASRNYVFVAGGIGITPYRAILLDLAHRNQPINIALLYANRTADYVFQDELETLAATHEGLRIKYYTGAGTLTADILKNEIAAVDQPLVYVSGPEPMVEAFHDILTKELTIPDSSVHADYFPGYLWS